MDLGGMPGICTPLQDPILSFSHTFLVTSACIRGPCPPQWVHAPPTGNPGSATEVGMVTIVYEVGTVTIVYDADTVTIVYDAGTVTIEYDADMVTIVYEVGTVTRKSWICH